MLNQNAPVTRAHSNHHSTPCAEKLEITNSSAATAAEYVGFELLLMPLSFEQQGFKSGLAFN